MQLIALVWGILAMLAAFVAFFPCLGALNWLVIPFAVIGLIIGVVAYAGGGADPRRNAKAGMVLCGIAIVVGIIRLGLGGGIL
ncbi:MAG TPA: hypothetical protein VN442_01500 [Bryobacteraceae bacterium]|nr:hypothetical protein [Bryobacteraceae bacterium]